MRRLLRTHSAVPGATNPAGWADNTAVLHVNSIRRIITSADAAGLPTDTFDNLRSAEVLDALERRLRGSDRGMGLLHSITASSNAGLPERTWGGVYLHSVLRSLRTCLHAAGYPNSPGLTARIKFYAGSKRRDLNHRLCSRNSYLAAAEALDAFGRLAQAAGHSRGNLVCLGACILAVCADGSPRRAEAGLAKRSLTRDNALSEAPEVRIFVPRQNSKSRRPRIIWLTHPTAIRLVEHLRTGPGGDELFRTVEGRPLTLPYMDSLLRRVTILALGLPASYNLLRRANAEAQDTTSGRAAQLANQGIMANQVYHPRLVANGCAAMAARRMRMREVAEQAGCHLPSLPPNLP